MLLLLCCGSISIRDTYKVVFVKLFSHFQEHFYLDIFFSSLTLHFGMLIIVIVFFVRLVVVLLLYMVLTVTVRSTAFCVNFTYFFPLNRKTFLWCCSKTNVSARTSKHTLHVMSLRVESVSQ